MNRMWKAIGVIALFTFASLAAEVEGDGGECARGHVSEGLIPIKEILRVMVVNATGDRRLAGGGGDLYVEFDHMGHKGRSLPLKLDDNSKDSLGAPVSLPTRATNEGLARSIKCNIKRRRRFLPEKTIATTDIDLRQQDGDTVTGIIRDRRGKDTGSHLKLILWDTEWVKGERDFDDNNDPPAKWKYIDLFYLVTVRTLGSFAGQFKFSVKDIKRPTEPPNPYLPKHELLEGVLKFPKEDEFIPSSWKVTHLAPLLNKIFRMTYRNNPLMDRASMKNEIRYDILKNYVLEPVEGHWHAPLSDASMHRIFFSSLGMHFTRKVNETDDTHAHGNKYVFDSTFYKDYAYKKNMENLGLKVYFNHSADITLIEDENGTAYQPGECMWEWAKLRARSAAFVYAAQFHLSDYHLNYANVAAMSLRKFLEPNHPLRVTLTPHFFRTHTTCLIAKDLLLAERSPIHRVMPFEYKDGHVARYNDSLRDFKFKTWPESLKEKGMLGDEYLIGATDGIALHKVLSDYASNLIDEIRPTADSFEVDDELRAMYEYLAENLNATADFSRDNLKKVWGEILFRVTGGHTSIGNTASYAAEPFMVNLRMQHDQRGLVLGNRETINVITLITGITQPDEYPNLASDWSVSWSNKTHSPEIKAYSQLREDLVNLGNEIEERNKNRRYVNVDFHPGHAMISVFS